MTEGNKKRRRLPKLVLQVIVRVKEVINVEYIKYDVTSLCKGSGMTEHNQ